MEICDPGSRGANDDAMVYGQSPDDAQPICPSCGITMHPLLDEGVEADECRDCGFRMSWTDAAESDEESDDEEDMRSRWW
ncbi:zf-TFIIB domain-containing protein [Microbacterium sp. LMI1-1-1.1]|uniref:zf-TFIIB domain-containing protein n=1 Tax=Microbacterium sp. LMI1-1-1.1 TaxID=3135223 RepID=UPI0034658DB1